MRELCRRCLGTGKHDAERMYMRDLNGSQIRGLVPCNNCRELGFVDYAQVENHKRALDLRQRMLRKAVDLGGSPYSSESRFFNVKEIRWNAISSVYFFPEKIAELLGLIFPGDLEDIEAAVQHASWDPSHSWRVKPCTADRRHIMRCKAIELQLGQQYWIHDWPEFNQPAQRDDRTFTRLFDLKTDIHLWRRGKRPVTSWRDAVEAVKAQSRADQAA